MARVSAPQKGDVVIRSTGAAAKTSYTLSTVPGPDQFGCASRAEAAQWARAYAGYAAVDVWRADGPSGFSLIARFRGTLFRADPTAHVVHGAPRRLAGATGGRP